MTIAELSPPGAEPITLAEARAHLRLDDGAEDGLLEALIRTARGHLEQVTGLALNGIEIDFIAGFGEAGTDVPDTLKRALLTHVAAMFELRGVLSPGDQPGTLPPGYERLVAPFRIRRL